MDKKDKSQFIAMLRAAASMLENAVCSEDMRNFLLKTNVEGRRYLLHVKVEDDDTDRQRSVDK